MRKNYPIKSYLIPSERKIHTNFEEMLNEILKYLNLHMIQEGEDFYIFDWKTVENNKQNPWTCILKKKLYDDNMEEIENNTTPTSNLVLSNKTISMNDYSSSDTNLSMSEIYNQIKEYIFLTIIQYLKYYYYLYLNN